MHKMGRRLRFAVRSRQARWGRLLDAFGGATYSQHIARSRRSSTEALLAVGPRLRHRVACARRGAWSTRTRAVAGHRTSTACHTFYGPPKPADQAVLALSSYRDVDSYLPIILSNAPAPRAHQHHKQQRGRQARRNNTWIADRG